MTRFLIDFNKNRVSTTVWKQSKKGCADENFSPKLINLKNIQTDFVSAALFGTLEWIQTEIPTYSFLLSKVKTL